MAKLKLWLRAVRPFAYPASVIPVILGLLLAHNDGHFNGVFALLTLLGVLLLHTGTNLINDYYDYRNGVDTPYSHGSSGVLVNALLEPGQLFRAALAAYLLALPIGIYLAFMCGLPVFLIGIAGMAGGYFYTAGPVAYKYRGMGVVLVFFLMGPLIVLGAYYVQAKSLGAVVLPASLPFGFLVAAILFANEYRDADHDSSHRIKNPAIALGRVKARLVYYALLGGAYIAVICMVVRAVISPWSLLIMLTLPNALKLAGIMEITARGKDSPRLPLIDTLTARLHLQFGLLMIAGIALGVFV